jgi:putative ABC transport system ATP-binding protein
MGISLETNQVTKIYGEGDTAVTAVDQASFNVADGEFVAVVGPSGSGKTTMLAMLATLLTPTNGSITIGGQNLEKMKSRQRTKFRRQNIGFTFQANNLVPFLTALENVELMLRLNKAFDKNARQRAKDLLDRLGLSHRLNNLPNQLSGGEQQRVAIARAMVHEPSLVLADEPTASLDTQRAFQVVETFASLIHEQNRAGIMVTHDLRMVTYVDKLISMVDGRIDQITDDRTVIDGMANTTHAPSSSDNKDADAPGEVLNGESENMDYEYAQ